MNSNWTKPKVCWTPTWTFTNWTNAKLSSNPKVSRKPLLVVFAIYSTQPEISTPTTGTLNETLKIGLFRWFLLCWTSQWMRCGPLLPSIQCWPLTPLHSRLENRTFSAQKITIRIRDF